MENEKEVKDMAEVSGEKEIKAEKIITAPKEAKYLSEIPDFEFPENCLFNKGKTGTYVKITSHQKEYGIYDISINKTINIDNENIIQIRNSEVYMKSATCPDQICIKQGHISQSGASIICLPHELIVEIAGEEGDLDDKAY